MEIKKYTLIIFLLVVSSTFNLFFRDVSINIALGAILFQFLASLVLGYVISMIMAKYRNNDWVKYWKIMYLVMISINIFTHFINFKPPS
jgi:hypothetical protein